MNVVFDRPKGIVDFNSPKAKYFVVVTLDGFEADDIGVRTTPEGLYSSWFHSPWDPTWAFENYWDAYAYLTKVKAGLIVKERNEKIRNLKATEDSQEGIGP